MSGDGSSPVPVSQTKKKKTLVNGHIECSSKQSLKKVRFVENTTNEKSDGNRKIKSVDYTEKREQINHNEHNNGGGSGKSNLLKRGEKIYGLVGKRKKRIDSCFNDKELKELDKKGIPDPQSEEKLA